MIRFTTGVALVLLLAACGAPPSSSSSSDDDVVSLATGPAPSAAAPERPLLRPDATQEEEDRLLNTYYACLKEHGVDITQRGSDATAQNWDAASAACAHLEPEALWERAERTDPHYADRLRDWVTCIRAHGIDAWEHDGHLNFESLPPEEQMPLVDECQAKAFATS
ncbi:hypothetical protein J2S43_007964 [Catenuloplanes nepalensis]|uniref:Lipoprotein n=1 Tax=Catenuloplanes nepalensis TaxID=587533 RepID=A0ABT9N6X6_9ACTN|nr:hypothetical protein [Catenuloplanes nepalensis]MDP9799452.1 hypothetical protein [Catenuloplanes nepalensis]